MDNLNDAQERALMILPAVSGSLSILGSACIVYMVLVKKPTKRTTYHRLLLGMSMLEILFSSQALFAFKILPDIHPYALFDTSSGHEAHGHDHHHNVTSNNSSDHPMISGNKTMEAAMNHTSNHKGSGAGVENETSSMVGHHRSMTGAYSTERTSKELSRLLGTSNIISYRSLQVNVRVRGEAGGHYMAHNDGENQKPEEEKKKEGVMDHSTSQAANNITSLASDKNENTDVEDEQEPQSIEDILADYVSIAACNAVGFLTHLAIGVAGYNAALSIYYFLTICWRMKAEVLARLVEPILHGTILVYIFGTATASVLLELFNVDECGLMCYIAPFPYNCIDDEDVDCIRGEESESYIWWFTFMELILFFAIIFICQASIYWYVRRTIRRIRRYSFDGRTSTAGSGSSCISRMCMKKSRGEGALSDQNKKLREVALQSGLYLAVFAVTWLPFTLTRLAHMFHVPFVHNNFVLFAFIIAVTFPLQGFLNFLVFLRPVYNKYRASNKEATMFRVFWAALSGYDMRSWRQASRVFASSSEVESRDASYESGSRFRTTQKRVTQAIARRMSFDGLSTSRSEVSIEEFVEDIADEGEKGNCSAPSVPPHDSDDIQLRSSCAPRLDGADQRCLARENSIEYGEYQMRLSGLSSRAEISLNDSLADLSDTSHQC
uniref:G-protein coupled receptors family 1 profile domain-containing protein n=1 Tax=Grammatophora oceanica TaxID=210454 RepID=A0A7S1Y7A8_9STRA|mmetsp:Transcript_29007/g.42626  ORF Transcript_29007/g.42626 Transcript_29007/m.42626 type:complete len:665 (+) Transcript_29007:69-2063(+)